MNINQAKAQLHTIQDFIRLGTSLFTKHKLFFGHGTDNSYDEALYLVLHALNLSYDIDKSLLTSQLIDAEKDLILDYFKQRIELRMPAAYITNKAYFAGLEFYVDQRAIIPRSPFAFLINDGLQPWLGNRQVKKILDLCCGSGCIAIACAYAFPDAKIDAVDISEKALEVAKINVDKHQCKDRIQLIQSDLFAELNAEYDLIISNPPYVSQDQLNEIAKEYKHEPKLALHSDEEGLGLASKILQQAEHYLNEDGLLFVEVGVNQEAFKKSHPEKSLTWLDLEHDAEGIFCIDAINL